MACRSIWKAVQIGTVCCLASLGSGCAVDVDLTTTPSTVSAGGSVDFDVKVTNRSTCPVGDIQVAVLPFLRESQISGSELFDEFLDALCSAGEFDGDGISGISCTVEEDRVVCTIFSDAPEAGETSGEVLFGTGVPGAEVRCSREGNKLTCQLPSSLAEVVEQQGAATPLSCIPLGGFVFCTATQLNVGEMQSDSFTLPATQSGLVRNLAFAIAEDDSGVCKIGTPGVPCDEDADCAGIGNACGDGICSTTGLGCDVGMPADCPGGTCTECGPPDDGLILAGAACTLTNVGQPAPAMSYQTLALTVVVLLGVGALALRRFGHGPRFGIRRV